MQRAMVAVMALLECDKRGSVELIGGSGYLKVPCYSEARDMLPIFIVVMAVSSVMFWNLLLTFSNSLLHINYILIKHIFKQRNKNNI